MSFVKNTACLLCDSARLAPVMSLESTPLANALDAPPTPTYPLDLDLCLDCQHLQLGISVDPKLLFDDYAYVSPPGMRPHWKEHADQMIRRFSLKPRDLVVEIGSNNGDMLYEYLARGMSVLGFEPAVAIAAIAQTRGVTTDASFFNQDMARSWAAGSHNRAKIVLANNVFAHVRDLHNVMQGVGYVMAPNGVFIAEVQYRADMIEGGYFDTIYHEHQHYHAVAPLAAFFERSGFHLFDVQRITTHGGSIRLFAQRKGGSHREEESVARFRKEEEAEPWDKRIYAFHDRIETARKAFRQILDSFVWGVLNANDKYPRIVGLGCPAKLTTLAYEFGIRPHEIDYVCDDAPTKIGKHTPGTHWPISPFGRILEEPPALAILFAWNYADYLIKRVREICLITGRPAPNFLIPFPTPRVLP